MIKLKTLNGIIEASGPRDSSVEMYNKKKASLDKLFKGAFLRRNNALYRFRLYVGALFKLINIQKT